MILNDIDAHFTLKNYSRYSHAQKCVVLNRAVSGLALTARVEASAEYGGEPERLSQAEIQRYLIEDKEYDAVDIGYIIKEFAEEAARTKKAGSFG